MDNAHRFVGRWFHRRDRRGMRVSAGGDGRPSLGHPSLDASGDVVDMPVAQLRIQKPVDESAATAAVADECQPARNSDPRSACNIDPSGRAERTYPRFVHGPSQNAFLDLDGVGAGNTLVLVNGHRVPGSPLTGGSSVDLNTLPLSAVERIEFLPPGAAAIHGSNALGGVVNVVLRDSVEGTEVEATAERPMRAGADSEWRGASERTSGQALRSRTARGVSRASFASGRCRPTRREGCVRAASRASNAITSGIGR